MVYDLTMLKTFYAAYSEKIERVRNVLRRPMTLAEKILYAHLYDGDKVKNYRRGEDYVNFRPDRVAMHGCNGSNWPYCNLEMQAVSRLPCLPLCTVTI